MRKSLSSLAILCSLAAPAFAGPCVALDYQEMKDMSVDELAKEACKVREALASNLKDTISNLGYATGAEPYPAAQQNFDQCQGQLSRMERVLESKGVTKNAAIDACNRRAEGGASNASSTFK